MIRYFISSQYFNHLPLGAIELDQINLRLPLLESKKMNNDPVFQELIWYGNIPQLKQSCQDWVKKIMEQDVGAPTKSINQSTTTTTPMH